MATSIRHSEFRVVRPATAVLALGAAFLAAGILAGQANAGYDARYASPALRQGVLVVDGSRADERIALRLKSGDPATLQVDFGDDGSAEFEVARADVARIAVRAGRGDDVVRIDEANGVFTDAIPTTLDGGRGEDTLAGGSGAEALLGGRDNDTIDGNRGNDTAFMGRDDDTFIWDPGDGSDVVEGQRGRDTMLFNGAGASERFDLSANGSRLRFFRDVGSITMDTNDVERVDLNALGGADITTVNDLSGTDVDEVDVDGSNPADSGAGDGQSDQVVVNGTNGGDAILVTGSNGSARVLGLAARVNATGMEAADTLTINALGGRDVVDASGLAANAAKLTMDGGDGNDILTGGFGDDVIAGGPDNDVLVGGPGQDTLDGGPGSNILVQ